MSSIANLGSTAAALPQFNLHPHGHKKGSQVQSTDLASSNTAPQLPVRAAQNMFANLLQSLEQAIGVQLTAPAAAAPAATATSAAGTAAGVSAASVAAAATKVSIKA
jgi:hypothetical protein